MKTLADSFTCYLVAAGAALVLGCSANAPVACSTELRGYPIAVTRELTTPFADAETLSLEACVRASESSPRCEVFRIKGAKIESAAGATRLDAVLRGSATATTDGKTRLETTFQVYEGLKNTKTPLTLTVKDAAGRVVLDVASAVTWSDEECHTAPVESSL